MKLIKVTKTVDEEYTDEEQDETVRQFEGDMADAPGDAFDEADAALSAGSKVKRRKALLSPEEQAKLAEEAEMEKTNKLEKEKALKANLKARAATWLARLPTDIGNAKKVLIEVDKSRLPEDQNKKTNTGRSSRSTGRASATFGMPLRMRQQLPSTTRQNSIQRMPWSSNSGATRRSGELS